MSDDLTVRSATSGEVFEDMTWGDTWTLVRLPVDRSEAVAAATERWGPPSPSVLPGERLWRLRAGDLPVCLSVCPGEEQPIVMFQLSRQPDEDLEQAVLDALTEMLSEED